MIIIKKHVHVHVQHNYYTFDIVRCVNSGNSSIILERKKYCDLILSGLKVTRSK